ncbi:hypothetical protein PIB30_023407 [Stylosanthes scabra]|uniref:Uncharacterized protein n=1 Tax=Stylosanthes scabra TaxID=79078 RepID=A0ABU6X9M5_9FABA|nr:hypothetical protein [Stylosanthes scabra]
MSDLCKQVGYDRPVTWKGPHEVMDDIGPISTSRLEKCPGSSIKEACEAKPNWFGVPSKNRKGHDLLIARNQGRVPMHDPENSGANSPPSPQQVYSTPINTPHPCRFDISEHTILLCLNSAKTLSDLSVGVFCRFSPQPVSLEIHLFDSLRQPNLGANWAHLVPYSPRNIGAVAGDRFPSLDKWRITKKTDGLRLRIPKQLQSRAHGASGKQSSLGKSRQPHDVLRSHIPNQLTMSLWA